MDSIKKELFQAILRYQSLYPKLTKEKCEELWGLSEKREQLSKEFSERVLLGLKKNGISSLEELSGEPHEKTLSKLKEVILKMFERMATKGNSSHKLQAVFSPLNFQRRFAPGGFRRSEHFDQHLRGFEEELAQFTREALSLWDTHVVFSNEALGEKRYPEGPGLQTIILEGSQRENNAASFLSCSRARAERVLLGENYFLKVVREDFAFFSSHFSSIKEEEREPRSEFFCQNRLPALIASLEEKSEGLPFAFAGDVNLYFFQETDKGDRILRKEVEDLLKKYQMILVAPSGLVNKNIRPLVHEQWHKLKEGLDSEVQAYPDSLVVLEPYDASFDYSLLEENGLGAKQDVFLPTGERKLQKVDCVREPFSKGFIMDHLPLRGRYLSILNGADGDGTGNPSKAFLHQKDFQLPSQEEHEKHLKAMRVNVESTCEFIESLNL